MGCRITELQCKEVVCVSDGCRLGFVSDVLVEIPDGCVKAIIVPGKCKMGGIISGPDEFIIPWSCICRIGDDIILVDCKLSDCRHQKDRPKWFG